jgi:hypothetical protein
LDKFGVVLVVISYVEDSGAGSSSAQGLPGGGSSESSNGQHYEEERAERLARQSLRKKRQCKARIGREGEGIMGRA